MTPPPDPLAEMLKVAKFMFDIGADERTMHLALIGWRAGFTLGSNGVHGVWPSRETLTAAVGGVRRGGDRLGAPVNATTPRSAPVMSS